MSAACVSGKKDNCASMFLQTLRTAGGGEAAANCQGPTGSLCQKQNEGQGVPQGRLLDPLLEKNVAFFLIHYAY